MIEAGVRVLDQPFYAEGNVATAGGWLAGYLLFVIFITVIRDAPET